MIKNYGADAVRFFILSDSPPEKDVQWSDQGMLASYKFIQKFWELNSSIEKKINSKIQKKLSKIDINEEINLFTNEILDKITFNIENFNYNVIIANLHEVYNFYSKKIIHENIEIKSLSNNYIKILKVMYPILPHLASECLKQFSNEIKFPEWPQVEKKYLLKKSITIVVQINGKKRGTLEYKSDINEENLVKDIIENNELKKYFENKKIIKKIYVKNKIINFLMK